MAVVTRTKYEAALDLAVRETKDKLTVANRRPTSEDGIVPADDVIDVTKDSQRFSSTVEADGVKATVTVTVAGE